MVQGTHERTGCVTCFFISYSTKIPAFRGVADEYAYKCMHIQRPGLSIARRFTVRQRSLAVRLMQGLVKQREHGGAMVRAVMKHVEASNPQLRLSIDTSATHTAYYI